jgi:hypothetical protein
VLVVLVVLVAAAVLVLVLAAGVGACAVTGPNGNGCWHDGHAMRTAFPAGIRAGSTRTWHWHWGHVASSI